MSGTVGAAPKAVKDFTGFNSWVIEEGTRYKVYDADGHHCVFSDANPSLSIEHAWGRGGSFRLFPYDPPERWTVLTPIDSQGDYVTGVADWGLELYAADNAFDDINLMNVTHDYVTLIGLNHHGNKANQPDYPPNYPVAYNTGDTLYIQGAEHFRGHRLYMHHSVHHGVNIDDPSKDIEVANSIMSYNAWNGMMDRNNCEHTRFISNWVEHSGDVGISIYGSYALVEANHVNDMDQTDGSMGVNGRWCIGFEGGTDNVARDNILTGPARLGIALEGAHWAANDNTIANMSIYGIHVNEGDGELNDNEISGIPTWGAPWPMGIQVAEIGTINNVKINDNTLDGDSGYLGVRIGDSTHTSGDNISLQGNTYDGTPDYCIYVRRDTTGLKIRDEDMLNGTRGIYVDPANANITDALIAGCWIFSMSTAAIDIQNCDDVLVSCNLLRDNAIGLDISNANSVRVAVDGNCFGGCGTGVSAAGVGSVVYGGNRNSAWAWIENLIPV